MITNRVFRFCPPSFPKDFKLVKSRIGYKYTTNYVSSFAGEYFLMGVCNWGNYIGDIIAEISDGLEKREYEIWKLSMGRFPEKIPRPCGRRRVETRLHKHPK